MATKRTEKARLTGSEASSFQREFLAALAPESHLHVALNHLSNTYTVIKDAAGRFVWLSDNLARCFGFGEAAAMIGLDDFALSPKRLARQYQRDDQEVLRSGRPMLGKVELVLNERGMLDWNVTNKLPLRNGNGEIIGLIATIQKYSGLRHLPIFGGELRAVVEHIDAHLNEPVRIARLAAIAGVSCRQMERRFRNATGMSPTDFVIRARLDEACRRLQSGGQSIGRIAKDLGFYDQSAFTRLFRKHLGTTPGEFRKTHGRKLP